MAIASKLQSGSVVLLDSLILEAPKTSAIAKTMKAIGLNGKTATLATAGLNQNAYLSGRNIPGLRVMPVSDLNAFFVLRPSSLVMTKDAMDWLKSRAS